MLASSEIDKCWAKVTLESVWRHVPFIDTNQWAEHVSKFGLPVILHKQITIPNPYSGKQFLELDHNEPYWFAIAGKVAIALGLPLELVLAAAFPVFAQKE